MAEKDNLKDEIILPVDWDIVDKSCGFAFDIGGSVAKLVFVSKDDWVEPEKRTTGSKGQLHLLNFARENLEEALDVITQRARLPPEEDRKKVHMYSTGIGGSQFYEDIRNRLHMSGTNLLEFECFVQSFLYLTRVFPRKDILLPPYLPGIKTATKIIRDVNDMVNKLRLHSTSKQQPQMTQEDIVSPQETQNMSDADKPLIDSQDTFPCLLAMCGSAYGAFLLDADGSYAAVGSSIIGGRTLLGLGSLLTGSQSYKELVELCEKGSVGNVSTTRATLKKDIKEGAEDRDVKQDPYKTILESDKLADDHVTFCFGLAVNKKLDDFNKEDLARGLLHTMVLHTVYTIHDTARFYGVKHVFFSGGFTNNDLVREMLTFEWVKKDLSAAYIGLKKEIPGIQVHFLKHGQSLGAMGAFLNHSVKWSEKTKADSVKQ